MLVILCIIILGSCDIYDDDIEEFSTETKLCKKKAKHTHKFDGAIMVPDQSRMRLMLLDGNPNANWNNNSSVLWKWSVKRGKGVPTNQLSKYRSVFTNLSDVRRIMYQNQIHLIFCGSHGNGIAMMNMKTGHVVYWANAGGSPHAIAALPDGNMVVADAKGYIKVFCTLRSNNSSAQKFRHAGAHGVVWDGKKQLMWAWGGTRMEAYKYNNSRSNPRLTSVRKYRLPKSWGKGGGHDLAPMLGTNKLLFSWRLGIGTFDTVTKQWVDFSRKGRNPKGLSYNPDRDEVIYTRPDSKDSRTYRVRSLTEPDRIRRGGKWYKAKWFIHNTFNYPPVLIDCVGEEC